MLMAYEVSRDLLLEDVEIETPLVKTTLKTLAGKKVAIIPILRAGLGMVDGILELIPAAKLDMLECTVIMIHYNLLSIL